MSRHPRKVPGTGPPPMADPVLLVRIPDWAKAVSASVNQHVVDGHSRSWAAYRLTDGGTDGTAYDTRHDAIGHQLHSQQCVYIRIPFDGMTPVAAFRYMTLIREAYDRGYRPEVSDDRDIALPNTIEGFISMMAGSTRR